MLVLSRSRGQEVVIDGTMTVTVLEIRGDKVKLGFTGPAQVPVHRKEVHDRLLQEGAWCHVGEPVACAS